MDAALTGLVGVTAGALLSGSVQSVAGWRERKRNARSSARLLYMELHNSAEMIEVLKTARAWERAMIDWHEPGATWKEHREALAGVLGTDEFLDVSAAFSYIAILATVRDAQAKQPGSDPDEPSVFGFPDAALDFYGSQAQAAKAIALKAALTWREQRRQPMPAQVQD